MKPPEYLDVDPRTLRLPPARASGADPGKLQRQIAQYGLSAAGMPTIFVYRGSDGELMIFDGGTRATPAMSSALRRELLQILGKLGDRYPDQRLGQLVANLSYAARGPAAESVWDAQDEELLRAAKELLERQERPRPSVA